MPDVTLRRATPADVAWLDLWDNDADVIACSTDDPERDRRVRRYRLGAKSCIAIEYSQYFIAELDGRPIGAMQICDPHLEQTHYWGEIAPNLRAIDIWIGAAADRGKGYGARDDAARARALLRRQPSDGDRHRSARVERAGAQILSSPRFQAHRQAHVRRRRLPRARAARGGLAKPATGGRRLDLSMPNCQPKQWHTSCRLLTSRHRRLLIRGAT